MFNIKSSSTWLSCDKITKGWSSDEKYRIETVDGRTLLLRISDISCFEAKKKEAARSLCILSGEMADTTNRQRTCFLCRFVL